MPTEQKPKTILEDWDGAVRNDDRYFSDIDEAVAHYHDDLDWPRYDQNKPDQHYFIPIDRFRDMLKAVPDFLECCDEKAPEVQDRDLDSLIDSIDEAHPVIDDEDGFGHVRDSQHWSALRAVLNEWIESTNWKYQEGNYTYVALPWRVVQYEYDEYESWLKEKFGHNYDCCPHSRECDCEEVCGLWHETAELFQQRYELMEELKGGQDVVSA